MDHTASDRRTPNKEYFSLALLLPRYLLIGQAVMVSSFGILIIGVVGLMHFASPPPNPFASYADIFPGQPSSAIDAYGFTCIHRAYSDLYDPSELRCGLNPDTGTFSHIEVVQANGRIYQLIFDIHPNTLSVGDLAVLLGITEFHPHGNVLFAWHGNLGFAQIINSFKPYSMLHRVWQVTLTDTLLIKPKS